MWLPAANPFGKEDCAEKQEKRIASHTYNNKLL